MWKFYALSWKEKSLEKFTNVSIGFDKLFSYYMNKNKDIKSFTRSKTFYKCLDSFSFDYKQEMNDLIEDFLFEFEKKNKIPSLLNVRMKFISKNEYKERSKS